MSALVAVIRRLPGGTFAKGPKTGLMPAVPIETTAQNFTTYFSAWPKHQAQFLLYGAHHQARFIHSEITVGTLLNDGLSKRGKSGRTSQASESQDQDDMHLYGPKVDNQGLAVTDGAAGPPRPDLGGRVAPVAPGNATAALPISSPKSLGLAGVMKRFKQGQKLTMVTAYDYPSARFARNAGAELVLVGDSLGNCRLGLPDTIGVDMSDMLRATTSVRRGVDSQPQEGSSATVQPPKPVIIGDMPFGSFLVEHDALKNAASFRKAGADMVKLEGGRQVASLVRSITRAGIAVMAHIGLEPQHALLQGGLKLQGTTADAALKLIGDAKDLVDAGAVAVVVECVPREVGQLIQAAIPNVPVIGIGAGGGVAGQVLVCDDLLGMHGTPPSFAKRYADLTQVSMAAYESFIEEVRSGHFPGPAHSRQMKPKELSALSRRLLEVGLVEPFSSLVSSSPEEASSATACPATSHQLHAVPAATSEAAAMAAAAIPNTPQPKAAAWARGVRSVGIREGGSTQAPLRFVHTASATSARTTSARIPVQPIEAQPGIHVLRTRAELNAWRQGVDRVALVPTMGNLHEGHLELVDAAKQRAEDVVASIFVNPAQFAAHEDFGSYPRTLERDIELLRARGASAVFCPADSAELYPSGSPGGTVVVPNFVKGLSEAACRPHFFTGVATVCLKLFNICRADVVVFGQKDAMQCVVIENMLKDLMLDTSVSLVVVPTSREADGLARSSRNSYLTADMRARAPAIFRSLTDAATRLGATPGSVRSDVKATLTSQGFEVQYVSVADRGDMQEKEDDMPLAGSVISIACLIRDAEKQCRLIDCIVV